MINLECPDIEVFGDNFLENLIESRYEYYPGTNGCEESRISKFTTLIEKKKNGENRKYYTESLN